MKPDNKVQPPVSAFVPFQEFFARESSGGIVLLIFTFIAIIWSNSPLSQSYYLFWKTPFTIGIGSFNLSKPIIYWINDGLMALFFFLVGLEIKREVMTGELSQHRKVVLPVSAALGGMLFPAFIYILLNYNNTGLNGWAIPVATDIAFSLGILSLLGNRTSKALKIFVTAFAIVDDIGAIIIIALFYTSEISVMFLIAAGIVFTVLLFLNFKKVQLSGIYIILGVLMWFLLLKSGIHATIAGILCALAIPSENITDKIQFSKKISHLTKKFEKISASTGKITDEQRSILAQIIYSSRSTESMLQRMEHALLPWVTFLIIPIFALANAGVTFNIALLKNFNNPVTLGIILGLFFGNQIGITLFSWLAIRTHMALLPNGLQFYQLYAASCLAGIGFTMSLFINGLSFSDPNLITQAKLGILTGSLLSGIFGWILLRFQTVFMAFFRSNKNMHV